MQRFTALITAALLSAGLMSATAHAQDASAQASSSADVEAAVQAQNFSDAELQKFADASKEIATISQDYTQRLQEAEDQQAQQDVRTEANQKMVEAVQQSGLEVEKFNAIGQAIQQNPDMMKRVQEMAQS
ncbi:DUF4168 domain-containing protein [Halomonas denitrificans]|uniref:DUF4168 domain-containing protein n=1 Tax=Halomonas TaxID=2745 RepID=UPI001A8F0FA2|nr:MULTISPECIES: DUF4168 domain-containing protein [Halomonas]MED5295345.1 DUF4168 domain-containing protein [Pseudomonadota bacterium]MBN8411511.1 DUF4168 domain-containing protein [Halomonas litopenaei]MBY5923975.1 DUF4168 domain-containing protein [Halomonas sp. DP4Y7-2]MBY5928126.1 DUF4168 domain-containing protein [Halomonas sp. DP8Y7-3]MBY5967326.1 DUF4168 domain-containing protein [Halomonas denitrificans]